jgi:hypothetical protein
MYVCADVFIELLCYEIFGLKEQHMKLAWKPTKMRGGMASDTETSNDKIILVV